MEVPFKTKFLFWFVIGFFSVFFAEVISGSAALAFVTLPGWLFVFPLYFLHCIVLITIIYRYGKPTLPVLFFAGAIFGLYEAYITKVLWNPHWNLEAIRFGGVAVFETVVLVLFWHVFMSFIVPIFVSQSMFTKSSDVLNLLPEKFQRRFVDSTKYKHILFWFFVFCGLVLGAQVMNPAIVFGAILSSLVLFVLLRKFWFRKHRSYRFEELLPNKIQFRVLVVLLVLYYVFTFFVFNYEMLPGVGAQFSIWLLYGLFIYLFVRALRKSRDVVGVPKSLSIKYSKHEFVHIFVLFVLFAFLGAFVSLAVPFVLGLVIVWFGGGLFGVWIFFESLEDTFWG